MSCPIGPHLLARRVVTPASNTISAAYGLYLIDLVARWNVTAEQLLAGLPVSVEQLAQPDLHVDIGEIERVIVRARRLTGEDGLGVYLGLQIPISAHGFLGFAAMTAKTLREAIELTVRYGPVRSSAFQFVLEVEGNQARLVVYEQADLGTARDVILIALLTSLANMGRTLVGMPVSGHIELALPEPPYYRRLAPLLDGVLYFGRARNQIVFEAHVLDHPLPMHDPVAQRLAREQCEQELARYGSSGQFLLRVRSAMRQPAGVVSGRELARRLGVSVRTLKRRLAQCGTSYSQLADELRYTEAIRLLHDDSLSMEEIAERLGYSDAANLTRAFRRWAKTTPAAFRRKLRDGREAEAAATSPARVARDQARGRDRQGRQAR